MFFDYLMLLTTILSKKPEDLVFQAKINVLINRLHKTFSCPLSLYVERSGFATVTIFNCKTRKQGNNKCFV